MVGVLGVIGWLLIGSMPGLLPVLCFGCLAVLLPNGSSSGCGSGGRLHFHCHRRGRQRGQGCAGGVGACLFWNPWPPKWACDRDIPVPARDYSVAGGYQSWPVMFKFQLSRLLVVRTAKLRCAVCSTGMSSAPPTSDLGRRSGRRWVLVPVVVYRRPCRSHLLLVVVLVLMLSLFWFLFLFLSLVFCSLLSLLCLFVYSDS